MRSQSDPITVWRQRLRLASAATIAAVTLSAVWAWWPRPAPPTIDSTLRAPEESDTLAPGPAPLDREAFAAAVWNPPPAPERPAQQAPTASVPPPPRLQLIGIARDSTPEGETVLRAALYDPDTDKLHLVAAGERVGAVTVVAVNPTVVSLNSGGRITELQLREDETS